MSLSLKTTIAMYLLKTTGIFETILASWWLIIVMILLLLIILWMQHVKAMRRTRVKEGKRQSPNTVIILGMVTIFVLILLALPWYLGTLEEAEPEKEEVEMPVEKEPEEEEEDNDDENDEDGQ